MKLTAKFLINLERKFILNVEPNCQVHFLTLTSYLPFQNKTIQIGPRQTFKTKATYGNYHLHFPFKWNFTSFNAILEVALYEAWLRRQFGEENVQKESHCMFQNFLWKMNYKAWQPLTNFAQLERSSSRSSSVV